MSKMRLEAITQMGMRLTKATGTSNDKSVAVKSVTRVATAGLDAARRKTSMKATQKLTEMVDGHHQ